MRGDEGLLAIAIENLLENARKFTAPGAAPRVRLEATGSIVRLSVVSPGARIGAAERESFTLEVPAWSPGPRSAGASLH